ncbi:hypothetical protein PROFUN_14154 [Planoprotostelium fungivorum]|uniref:Endoplasmic reticulum transmembrane protein n=1 Tax=Planoprotostelium fungivorum TaxID=1890364 RepID=A0A2P6N1L4_9EUKA|nr:hypothetical protein PROFUN_14154 [Planoprotostelium fungivorum]
MADMDVSAPAAQDNFIQTLLLEYANQWGLIFVCLSIEILIATFLVLPIPVKWRITVSQKMAVLWNQYPRFRIITKTLMSIVAALFFDSLRKMYVIHLSIYQPDLLKVGREAEINKNLLVAQRNAYLCGFTVFIFMILYRFQSMADQVATLEAKLDQIEPGLSKRTEHHVQKAVDYDKNKEAVQNNPKVSKIN